MQREKPFYQTVPVPTELRQELLATKQKVVQMEQFSKRWLVLVGILFLLSNGLYIANVRYQDQQRAANAYAYLYSELIYP